MNGVNHISPELLAASVFDVDGEAHQLGDVASLADGERAIVLVFLRHYG